MKSEFTMTATTRDRLIGALLGDPPPDVMPAGQSDVTLIYRASDAKLFPSAIIVEESDIQDFFVWLETYAPQFTPITQYCRVLTTSEAQRYLNVVERTVRDLQMTRWCAGLVVGEIIAQASGDPIRALDAATLAQAQSTYSFAMGRSQLLWYNRASNAQITGILGDFFDRMLLGNRAISPEDLQDVWDVTFGGIASGGRPDLQAVMFAVHELRRADVLTADALLSLARFFEPARELLQSEHSSAEERVLGFDQLLRMAYAEDLNRSVALFCIAYAAIGIGGGTTRHMNLLVDVGAKYPLVWLWFGLIGSMGPDTKWHPMFAKLARLVARDLSYSLHVLDAPRSDIDWREAMACGGTSGIIDWLRSIPRSNSRSAVIELEPGVALTVPLNQARAETRTSEPQQSLDVSRLDEALSQLWAFRQQLLGVSERRTGKAASRKKGKNRRGTPTNGDRLI